MNDHEYACDLVVNRLATDLADTMPAGPLASTVDELLHGVRATFAATAAHNTVSVHVPLAFAPPLAELDHAHPVTGAAAACTAFYVGARLLDDLMDGHDVSYFGTDRPSAEVMGWATFLMTMPSLILARLDAPAEVRLAAVDAMSSGVALMAAGQLGDVRVGTDVVSVEAAMAAIRGKTGALLATFARCAALVHGYAPADLAHVERYGYGLGICRQIRYDLRKFDDEREPLPYYLVALHAAGLDAGETRAFGDRVAASTSDVAARSKVADELRSGGAPARAVLTAELHVSSAIASLEAVTDERLDDRPLTLAEQASQLSP